MLLVTGSRSSTDTHVYLISQHPRSLLTLETIWNEKFEKKTKAKQKTKRERNLQEGSVTLKKALYHKFKSVSLYKTSEILSDTSDAELVTADFPVHLYISEKCKSFGLVLGFIFMCF